MLILTEYIAKHEFGPLKRYFNIDDLLGGARKVIQGLGQSVAFSNKTDFRFFKVRIGNKPKGRMIVFVVAENKKVVPLLIRLKKDKKIGMNMSSRNKNVIEAVDKNLGCVIDDIKRGKFKEFEL